jgi:uncharacterized protein
MESQLEDAIRSAFGGNGSRAERSITIPLSPRKVALIPELRAIDEAKRTIEFVASTERVDRYKDVLRVSGWDTKAYEKNPVFLWAHKSSDIPPIGRTISLKRETTPAPALVATVEFTDQPFAKQIYDLYKGKFLNSVSVGFRPTVPPEPIMNDAGEFSGGYEFKGMELLELSAVNVPANVDCVARAIDTGVITAADAERIFRAEDSADVAAALDEMKTAMESMASDVAECLSLLKKLSKKSVDEDDLFESLRES